MDTSTLETRFEIVQAAVELYEQDPGQFTIMNVGGITGLTPTEIYALFNSKEEILLFWYEALVHRYRVMVSELDGFEDLTVAEKISNFIYASIGMMEEHRGFVEQTFDTYIYRSSETTGLEKELNVLITSMIEDDERVPGFNRMFTGSMLYGFLATEYLQIVQFWIGDKSENSEKTLELVDKLTSLLEEILYNAVINKGFDLTRFLYENGSVSLTGLWRFSRWILPF